MSPLLFQLLLSIKKNGKLSGVGFFLTAPPGSVQSGSLLDDWRKNLSEDGHYLHDATCALRDAVDATVCSACVLFIYPRHLSMSRDVLEDWLLTYPGI